MSENEEKACCSKSLPENIERSKNGRFKRKPESSNDDSRAKSHRKKDTITVQMNQCKQLLRNFRTAKEHHDYTQLFKYPVDPIAFECPDYYDIIKNPMDLSTMQIKMDKGEYKTPADFENDMQLIVDNAITYNGSDHAIFPIVEKFRKVFNCRFQKIVNPKPRLDYLALSASEISMRKSSRSFVFIPDDEESLVKEIAKTQKYLKKLYEKYKALLEARGEFFDINDGLLPQKVPNPPKKVKKSDSEKKKKSVKKQAKEVDLKQQRHLSSSSDDEDNQIPMTYDEKRELVLDINKLPSEKIQEISKIVKTTDPDCYLELEKNFEINFSECKIKTLRALQKITNDFFRPKPSRAVALPRKEKLEKDRKLVEELKIDLEIEKKECETKLATVENKLAGFIRKKAKSPTPMPQLNNSTSSGSSSTSSSSSSSSSSSDSSDDEEFKG